MTTVRHVAPGIVRIETRVTGTDMPLAMHAVEGDLGWTLIDTGCVGMIDAVVAPVLASLRDLPIERALVTHAHADHFGGNHELLARYPGCVIYAHEADVAWASDPERHIREAYGKLAREVPCPEAVRTWVAGLLGPAAPVRPMRGGDRFEVGAGRTLEIIDLPGHSPGHIGVWDARERVLVLSDALLADGQRVGETVVGIPSYLDVHAYVNSIARVRALRPSICLPAHFPVLDEHETQAFCDASDRFVTDLDLALLDALDRIGPATLHTLTSEVVPTLAPAADGGMVAALSLEANLARLVEWEHCRVEVHGGVRTWHRVNPPHHERPERSAP